MAWKSEEMRTNKISEEKRRRNSRRPGGGVKRGRRATRKGDEERGGLWMSQLAYTSSFDPAQSESTEFRVTLTRVCIQPTVISNVGFISRQFLQPIFLLKQNLALRFLQLMFLIYSESAMPKVETGKVSMHLGIMIWPNIYMSLIILRVYQRIRRRHQ